LQQEQQYKKLNFDPNGKGIKKLSMISATKNILVNEGILGLWRGTIPTILRNVPGSSLYFFSLHVLRSGMRKISFKDKPALSENVVNLSAGMIARVSVGLVFMPATVLKIRFEVFSVNSRAIYTSTTGMLMHSNLLSARKVLKVCLRELEQLHFEMLHLQASTCFSMKISKEQSLLPVMARHRLQLK
jgi:solute carrier family 25 protein 38